MSKNIFKNLQVKKPQTSYFDLTHDVKMSGQFGHLMPCLTMDVMPGDKISLGADIMVRMMPMLAPIMHRVDVYVHYFFVPNRILWDNWENWITGVWMTPDAGVSEPVWPYLDTTDWTEPQKRLADYFGIPFPAVATAYPLISALPFAAYNRIIMDYYTDEVISQGYLPDGEFEGVHLNDALNDSLVYKIRSRMWEHDRFTTARPWAQKGADVQIPTNDTDLRVLFNHSPSSPSVLTGVPDNVVVYPEHSDMPGIDANELFARQENQAGNSTINDLRVAQSVQRWLEKNARAGTKYWQSLLVHFGVRSPDSRLQRAEYITGLKAPVVISEVLATATTASGSTGDELPQGNMSGHGISVSGGNTGTYYVQEHGWIMGIVSILPKPAYQQGIDKKFQRNDPLEYPWPEFANLGEQPIYKKEIFGFTPADDDIFGYTPRYSEMKYAYSRVAGEFRTTLDFWHLGRIFSSPPVLGDEFCLCEPDDASRIFATQGDEAKVLMHILNRVGARRPLPTYGTPI